MGAASKRRRSGGRAPFFQRARSVRYRLYRRSLRGRRCREGSPRPPRRKSLGSSKQMDTLGRARSFFFSARRRFAIVCTGVPCSLRGAQCMGRRFIFRALRGKSKKRIKHEKAAGLPRRLSLSLWLYLTIVSPASLPNTTVSTTALPPRRFAPWMPPVTSPAATRPGITSPLVSSTRHSVSIFTPPIV